MSASAPPFELLDAARDLIAADSVSAHGNGEAVAVLRPLMERAGLAVELRAADALGTRHHNVVGAHPNNPTDDGGLLLVTHTDTVDPGDPAEWTSTGGDPFRLTVDGERIYGLGVADVKIDALCKILALWRTREATLSRPVHALFTFGEEVGLLGAKRFVADGRPRYAFASAGEPSELCIVHAHKGYVVLRVRATHPAPPVVSAGEARTVRFQGKTAHSSTPHLGDSAVEQALDRVTGDSVDAVHDAFGGPVCRVSGGSVANRVPPRCEVVVGGGPSDISTLFLLARRLREEWARLVGALSPGEDARFDPSRAVYNIGRLQLEAESGEGLFHCRLLPGHDGAGLAARFTERAQPAAAALGLTAEVEIERLAPAMAAPRHGPLIDAAVATARDVGTPPEPVTKATNTEAGTLASTGAEAMVFGPGVSVDNVHQPNEYNLLPQIHRAVDFYETLVRRLCGSA